MWRWMMLALMAVVALDLTACMSGPIGPRLAVEDAWARPVAAGGNSFVYFRLVNSGNGADTLLGVDSPVATAELRQTTIKDDGTTGMEPVGGVEIPAKGIIAFKQGGMVAMLIGVETSLAAGDRIPLMLRFDHAGELRIEVEVKEQ